MYEIIGGLFELLGSGILPDGTVDGKRVRKNIEKLQHYDWFTELQEQEKYRQLFVTNYKVRRKLQRRLYVRRLIRSPRAQSGFIRLLNKQIKV